MVATSTGMPSSVMSRPAPAEMPVIMSVKVMMRQREAEQDVRGVDAELPQQ